MVLLYSHQQPITINQIEFRGETFHARMAYALSQHRPTTEKIDQAVMHARFILRINGKIEDFHLPLNLQIAQCATSKVFKSAQKFLFKSFVKQKLDFPHLIQKAYPDADIICHGIILEMHNLKPLSPTTENTFLAPTQYYKLETKPDFTCEYVKTPPQSLLEFESQNIKEALVKQGIRVENEANPFLALRTSCAAPGQSYSISPEEYTAEKVAKYSQLDATQMAQLNTEYTIACSDPDAPPKSAPKVNAVKKPSEKKPYPPGPHARRKIEIEAGSTVPRSEEEFSAAGAAEIANASPNFQAIPQVGALKRPASPTKTKKQARFKAKNEVEEASLTLQYNSQSSQTSIHQETAASAATPAGSAFSRTHTGTDGALLRRMGAGMTSTAAAASATSDTQSASPSFFQERQLQAPAKFSFRVNVIAGAPSISQSKTSESSETKIKDEDREQPRPAM
jgi:hypothetical protein